jgi:hypothetical protein
MVYRAWKVNLVRVDMEGWVAACYGWYIPSGFLVLSRARRLRLGEAAIEHLCMH